MNWISVKERLAPRHQTVIALNRDGRIFDARVCYGMHAPFWTYPSGHKDASDTCPGWIDVTHWMPLPESPTESLSRQEFIDKHYEGD